MSYAVQADIETRYPGELAQAGPRDPDGELDAAAIAQVLADTSALADGYLTASPFGYTVPLDPVPVWLIDIAVDISLYQATPTVLASQTDFLDRRKRYEDAIALLEEIAAGKWRPADASPEVTVYVTSRERVFGRGTL